jgi:hypothetical protein
MTKAKKRITKATKRITPVGAVAPAPQFLPMPASHEGWAQVERITRLAFSVLESEKMLVTNSSIQLYVPNFADAALALKKMSTICAAAAGKITAAQIRVGRKGVRKPAKRKAA